MDSHRPYNQWILVPPHDPAKVPTAWSNAATVEIITDELRKHAEIARIGRQRFNGTLREKNALWREFRNYMRQALSNYQAAMAVSNRSACLLQYYALLNFAKAELLSGYSSRLVNNKIGHGLSFSPVKARSVSGDYLTVHEGVFKLLYEHRTGQSLAVGTKLPLRRILANIPEIGTELAVSGVGETKVYGIIQMLAKDDAESWPILACAGSMEEMRGTKTGSLFFKYFKSVATPSNYRDHFGLSRRAGGFSFYESREAVPLRTGGGFDYERTTEITWQLRDILSRRADEGFDAILTPYLYKTRPIPMPTDLARYAVIFYASSLVRYRPYMFDSQIYPDQAFLFDGIARDCSLPILIDTLCGIEERDQIFNSEGSYRV